jgi:hypothetical protein
LDFRNASVGRVLFVACDGERTPYRLAEQSVPDSIRCVVVQNVPSVIILATRLKVDPGLVGIVQQVLRPYISRDTVVKAFERDAARAPLEKLHTTDARDSSGAHVVRRVINRLELWKRLEHPDVNRRLWPFHSGLREYLLLTCFDQLGAAPNWMSLTAWLSSTDPQEVAERNSVPIPPNTKPDETAEVFVKFYNARYGVRSAFRRFIREVLPNDQRQVLLDSLYATKSPLPLAVGLTRTLSDTEKENLLFTMRNAFTHRGISHTHLEDHPADVDPLHFPDTVRMMGSRIGRTERIDWGVRDWPRVLEESVLWGLVSYVKRLALTP